MARQIKDQTKMVIFVLEGHRPFGTDEQTNPVNTDTEVTMDSVCVNKVSLLNGSKIQYCIHCIEAKYQKI